MSISDNYAPTKQQGDGTTTEYTASWALFNEDYLRVIFEDTTTGVQTVQSTGFTVAFTTSLVTVTFSVAPPNTVYVILARSIPLEQQSPYKTSRGFQGKAIETSLDLLTAMVQDQQDQIDRAPKSQVGSNPLVLPTYSAGLNLGWSTTTENEIAVGTKTLAEIDAAVGSVEGLIAGSGILVSSNDTTIGFLNGKLIAGDVITLTENNDGGNETLTVSVANKAVTNAKLADMAQDTVKGRASGAGTGVPTDLTAAQVRTIIKVENCSPELRPIISNNGTDPNKDIDIAAGRRVSSDGSIAMILASALTKQLDATWAAGTNAGGRSSSVSLSPSTWYHVFLIQVAGSIDVGFDTSVTAANLITDHGATDYARIGSILTDGSSNILAFKQYGNEFIWAATKEDVNVTTSGTTASTRTLTVPTGVKVIARIRGSQSKSAAGISHIFTSLDANDEAPTGAGAVGNHSLSNGSSANGIAAAHFSVRTNTSAQIRTRASAASCSLAIETFGWVDSAI